jgi:hypothetical protein
MHHLVQEELSRIFLPYSLLCFFELAICKFFLHLVDLIHQIVAVPEWIAHGDVVVLVPKPPVVARCITSNTLTISFDRTSIFLIIATKNYVEVLLGQEIGCSLQVFYRPCEQVYT